MHEGDTGRLGAVTCSLRQCHPQVQMRGVGGTGRQFWFWMGLESPHSNYSKLDGADTLQMSRELRGHGITLLGSTIIGLEHHTPENITAEIEHAIAHETDLHQFMLYTPVPGTPLYSEMAGQGKLLDVDLADIHGQLGFNFQHVAISREESKKFLDWAFWRDFERNGPSLFRICRVRLSKVGSVTRNHPDLRVRERFEREAKALRRSYAGMLWAMEHRLKETNLNVSVQIRALRQDLEREFGLLTAAAARLLGPVLWWTSLREDKRLAQGHGYEPLDHSRTPQLGGSVGSPVRSPAPCSCFRRFAAQRFHVLRHGTNRDQPGAGPQGRQTTGQEGATIASTVCT